MGREREVAALAEPLERLGHQDDAVLGSRLGERELAITSRHRLSPLRCLDCAWLLSMESGSRMTHVPDPGIPNPEVQRVYFEVCRAHPELSKDEALDRAYAIVASRTSFSDWPTLAEHPARPGAQRTPDGMRWWQSMDRTLWWKVVAVAALAVLVIEHWLDLLVAAGWAWRTVEAAPAWLLWEAPWWLQLPILAGVLLFVWAGGYNR